MKTIKLLVLLLVTGTLIFFAGCNNQKLEFSTGRDTVAFVGNGKFQIGNFGKNKALAMNYAKNTLVETLLSGVESHKKIKNLLFVVSSEGYAVVDGDSNTCRLVITVEKQQIARFEDSEENKNITILESYDLFNDYEKKVFEEIMQN